MQRPCQLDQMDKCALLHRRGARAAVRHGECVRWVCCHGAYHGRYGSCMRAASQTTRIPGGERSKATHAENSQQQHQAAVRAGRRSAAIQARASEARARGAQRHVGEPAAAPDRGQARGDPARGARALLALRPARHQRRPGRSACGCLEKQPALLLRQQGGALRLGAARVARRVAGAAARPAPSRTRGRRLATTSGASW